MPDLDVRFLDDLSAPVRRFTYLAADGTELGEIVCDPSAYKGWSEIRWLRFPDEERLLLVAGKVLEARELLIGLLADWVTAQNPDWTPERILSAITIREAYHLLSFFAGRLLGPFATAASQPPEKRRSRTAASPTRKPTRHRSA